MTSDDIVLSDGMILYFRPRKRRELMEILMCLIRCISQKKNENCASFCGPKIPISLPLNNFLLRILASLGNAQPIVHS